MDILFWLIPIAVAGFVAFIIWKKKKGGPKRALDLARKARLVQTSPKGLRILGKAVSDAELRAFDEGAAKYFEIAEKCLGYTNKLRHTDWTIFVLDSFLSPVYRTPSYNWPYPLEEKSDLIVGGEYLVSDRPEEQTMIAVADPQGQLVFAHDIIYNELEHGGAHQNNEEDYRAGAYPGHVHPLVTDCRKGMLARVIDSFKSGVCGFRLKR